MIKNFYDNKMAIRPGAKSIQKFFFGRKKYEFGIDMLDKKLQGGHSDSSFMLFQEQAMECLSMSGIPMKDTYDIIKAISKKKIDVINSYKAQFIEGMTKRLLEENV